MTGERGVEAQGRVVEHRGVGGEQQVVDLGVPVTSITWPLPGGCVEAVAAQQDHVVPSEGLGGTGDGEVQHRLRPAEVGGEVVAPRGA